MPTAVPNRPTAAKVAIPRRRLARVREAGAVSEDPVAADDCAGVGPVAGASVSNFSPPARAIASSISSGVSP